MSDRLGEKSLACLRLAALHSDPHRYEDRSRLYEGLCVLYSEKAVCKKMEDLATRGYIDYGVSARTGWLTDKGKEALVQ